MTISSPPSSSAELPWNDSMSMEEIEEESEPQSESGDGGAGPSAAAADPSAAPPSPPDPDPDPDPDSNATPSSSLIMMVASSIRAPSSPRSTALSSLRTAFAPDTNFFLRSARALRSFLAPTNSILSMMSLSSLE